MKALAIAAALAFLYWNVLLKLAHDCWDDQNYSHSLLVPFIIGYILWVQRDYLINARKKAAVLVGGTTVVLSLLLLWAGIAGAELFLQRISLVFVLAGIVIYFWGFSLLPKLAAPFALLVLAIPVPAIVLNKVTFPLQLFASRCAVSAMRLFDIPVLREGNIIELMPLNSDKIKRLEVVEACSGIRSLMTLMTLALVLAYFTT
ncbi:MAG TPA: exosortase/archaeosortase family protein, partial [Pyrinomonadaceae bacterium]|nr:exosortase/archaeosortase family protein [Pyrinomonadaceae bacterium]